MSVLLNCFHQLVRSRFDCTASLGAGCDPLAAAWEVGGPPFAIARRRWSGELRAQCLQHAAVGNA